MSEIDYKKRAVEQWTKNPIGAESTNHPEGTKGFFDEIAKNRYEVCVPWLKETFKFGQYRNKKVLEIGCGIGTDHLELAKAGAILTGIDITPKSIELTKKNLELHGYHSNLIVADAENLPFKDNDFDAVYSFGVLHHLPDIQKAVNEIYRVLVPGTKTIVSLYNKYSLFALNIFLRSILTKKGFKERLPEIECGGGETRPLVRLYSKKGMKKLFKKFKRIKITTRHISLGTGHKLNKLLNIPIFKKLLELLSLKFGWYLIIEATK